MLANDRLDVSTLGEATRAVQLFDLIKKSKIGLDTTSLVEYATVIMANLEKDVVALKELNGFTSKENN